MDVNKRKYSVREIRPITASRGKYGKPKTHESPKAWDRVGWRVKNSWATLFYLPLLILTTNQTPTSIRWFWIISKMCSTTRSFSTCRFHPQTRFLYHANNLSKIRIIGFFFFFFCVFKESQVFMMYWLILYSFITKWFVEEVGSQLLL